MKGKFKLNQHVKVLFDDKYEDAIIHDIYENGYVVMFTNKMIGNTNLLFCHEEDITNEKTRQISKQ